MRLHRGRCFVFCVWKTLAAADGLCRPLFHARVAVFGIGGVGGYTMEALARSGVGTWTSSTTTGCA